MQNDQRTAYHQAGQVRRWEHQNAVPASTGKKISPAHPHDQREQHEKTKEGHSRSIMPASLQRNITCSASSAAPNRVGSPVPPSAAAWSPPIPTLPACLPGSKARNSSASSATEMTAASSGPRFQKQALNSALDGSCHRQKAPRELLGHLSPAELTELIHLLELARKCAQDPPIAHTGENHN